MYFVMPPRYSDNGNFIELMNARFGHADRVALRKREIVVVTMAMA
jgi:hypothetical protein